MKEYKIKVLDELTRISKEFHSMRIFYAAQNVGIKHLKRQEVIEIAEAFIKKNPEYKMYTLEDFDLFDSLFCKLFFSDNETPPVWEFYKKNKKE